MVNSSASATFPSTRTSSGGEKFTPGFSASRPTCLSGRRDRGFSLVELMIGVVLASLILGIGLPTFQDFITEQRLRAASADLHIALMTARSEAIKRNRVVELKPIAGGWSDGWVIPSPIDDDPDILRFKQTGEVAIDETDGALEAKFTPMGRVLSPVNFQLEADPQNSGAHACLQLRSDGRIDYIKEACPDNA
jgi:type IV fimbrial biogenesis protein FimT